jgi:hypothetical protein
MRTMSVFLPLASAAGWFEGAHLREALALRLKVLLAIEDQLVFDPRAFRFHITASDVSEQFFPDAGVPWSRDDPNIVGVTQGNGTVEMRMDWRPLLAATGFTGSEGIRFSDAPLAPAMKRALRAHIDTVAAREWVAQTLPANPRVREAVVKHWILDCASAAGERCTIAVDVRAGAFVEAVNLALAPVVAKPGAPLAPLTFLLHDIRRWTWDAVRTFRSSSSGDKLRALVADARKAHTEGGDLSTLQARIDGVTGRSADDAGVRVACLPAYPHALADIAGPASIVYIIGAG